MPSGRGQFPKRHVSPKGRDNIMRWPMIACLVQVFPAVILVQSAVRRQFSAAPKSHFNGHTPKRVLDENLKNRNFRVFCGVVAFRHVATRITLRACS